MVDTQRFRIGPHAVAFVSDVTATLAGRGDGEFSALVVATYVPLDVESVARILDSLEAEGDVHRVQREDGVCYYDAESLQARRVWDLDSGDHLDDCQGFTRNLDTLRQDADWLKKTREQHEVLRIAANSKKSTLELGYFTSRCELPSAKIQSILNDIAAEGYIHVDYEDDSGAIRYTFPPLVYPKSRYARHMEILDELAARPGRSQRYWVAVVMAAAVILALVILAKLSLL
jgi:hypothetical protein